MQLTDLLLHVPNFLSPEECQILIDAFNKREESEWRYEGCTHAFHGRTVISTFRSLILTDPEDEAYQLFRSSTEKIINLYHDYLDSFDAFHKNIKRAFKYSHEYRLMKYYPGSWIHPHTDSGVHDPWVYGSCTFNLNDEYTGGDFVFFNGRHRVKLGRGDAMIWPADYFWVHHVEEVQTGIRYSANTFLQCLPQEYKMELVNSVIHNHPGSYNIK